MGPWGGDMYTLQSQLRKAFLDEFPMVGQDARLLHDDSVQPQEFCLPSRQRRGAGNGCVASTNFDNCTAALFELQTRAAVMAAISLEPQM